MDNISGIVENAIKQANEAEISHGNPDSTRLAKMREDRRVRPTDAVEADPVVLWVQGDTGPVPFGTLGNFSMITGKAKTKKSFTLCLTVAPAIHGSHYAAGPFTCEMPADKYRVAYFDTEQGKHRVWKAVKRACRLAGVDDPPHLEYYNLRADSTKDRVLFINYILTDCNPDKNIGLVIIDGCRDLVHDFNDPKEATELATHFMQWTANAQCHLITVLHQNKADTNARGHVGAELTNKAETVITVEIDSKDKSVSIVEPRECRGESFTGFAFTVNGEGLPEVLPNYEMGGKGGPQKKPFDPYHYPAEIHKMVLDQVFNNGPINGRDEYIQKARVGWGSIIQSIGENAAKMATAYWGQMGWVSNGTTAGKKAVYQYVKAPPGLGG